MGLTDARTINQSAPFDHPELFRAERTPSGCETDIRYRTILLHPGQATDQLLTITQTGKSGGRPFADISSETCWRTEAPFLITQTARIDSGATCDGAITLENFRKRLPSLAANDNFPGADCSGRRRNRNTPPSPAKVPAVARRPLLPLTSSAFFCNLRLLIRSAHVMQSPVPRIRHCRPGCKSAGGWLQINGHVIRVPQNTILQMPANTLTWEEVFEYNPAGSGR